MMRLTLDGVALAGLGALTAIGAHSAPVDITPPVLVETPSDEVKAKCYGRHPEAGRITLAITISAEGKVTHIELPPGAAPWMGEAAECIASKMSYVPGKRDGVPVEAKGFQTFVFNHGDGDGLVAEFSSPTVKTTAEQVIDIYRRCYPSGVDTEARVLFKVTITERGLVQTPKLLESSGNAQLDEAATCILTRLRFHPARRGDKPARATLTWPILVRPPPQP